MKKVNYIKLYEFLDWYKFVNETEVSMAVVEFFFPHAGEEGWEQPSYGELSLCDELAQKYIADRDLSFDE